MSHSFKDLPTISLDQEKKPSTTCARTGTEAYHHMAIPSPEPTSAMMTEPGVSEENFSSCREACAATSYLSMLVGNRAVSLTPCFLLAKNTQTQTNRTYASSHPFTSANLALGRFPSDPLTARFQAGHRGSARTLPPFLGFREVV